MKKSNLICLTLSCLLPSVAAHAQTIRTYTGSPGEASAAIDLENAYSEFLSGDNEDETLRFYPFGTGGAPRAGAGIELTTSTTWTAGTPGATPNKLNFEYLLVSDPGYSSNGAGGGKRIWRDGDFEGAARIGQKTYWIGSHSNAWDTGTKYRPNRRRLVSIDLNTARTAVEPTTFKYYGTADVNLRSKLVDWDSGTTGSHRADSYGFPLVLNETSHEDGLDSFNIEGLSATERGTLFLGFRSPLVDPLRRLRNGAQVRRTHAIIVELTNQDQVLAGAQQPSFGRSFELDLGGRGIRDMRWNGDTYFILAGRVSLMSAVDDFALFTWKPGFAPILRFANFPTTMTPEAIAKVPAGDHYTAASTDSFSVTVLSDDGTGSSDRDPSHFGNFRSYEFTVAEPGSLFKFDPIPPLVLHNSSLGLSRRVRLSGLQGTGVPDDDVTLTASVLSGSSLVPSVAVINPGLSGEQSGAIDFTPSASATTPQSAQIMIRMQLVRAGVTTTFSRILHINNYSALLTASLGAELNSCNIKAISSTGFMAGQHNNYAEEDYHLNHHAITWNRFSTAMLWPKSLKNYSAIHSVNDYGVAAGLYGSFDSEGVEERSAWVWPAMQGTPVQAGVSSSSQGLPVSLPGSGFSETFSGTALVSVNNFGRAVFSDYWNGSTRILAYKLSPLNAAPNLPASIAATSSPVSPLYSMSNDGVIPRATIADNGTCAAFISPGGSPDPSVAVWESDPYGTLTGPTVLADPGFVPDFNRALSCSASNYVCGMEWGGTQIARWKKTSSGWSSPDVLSMSGGSYSVAINYHGQILRSYSSGTDLVDSGVNSTTWPQHLLSTHYAGSGGIVYSYPEGIFVEMMSTGNPWVRVPNISN